MFIADLFLIFQIFCLPSGEENDKAWKVTAIRNKHFVVNIIWTHEQQEKQAEHEKKNKETRNQKKKKEPSNKLLGLENNFGEIL